MNQIFTQFNTKWSNLHLPTRILLSNVVELGGNISERLKLDHWVFSKLTKPLQDARNVFINLGHRAPVHATFTYNLVFVTVHKRSEFDSDRMKSSWVMRNKIEK